MHVFFSVGEPSGDQHAAHLMMELRRRRPDLRFSGFGGPAMEREGCRLLYPLTNLAVMGIFQVVPLLWQFLKLVWQAGRFLREERPDLVVLVDFPGFNWWIARKAKAAGIPVLYYLPPQLWAWAPWRIRRVRKFVDQVLCALPFEYEWYRDRGIDAVYVGHPFFDEVAEHRLDRTFCQTWLRDRDRVTNVAVLPGSRKHEVTRCWPLMLQVIRKLSVEHPDVRFLVACYRESQRKFCIDQLRGADRDLPIHFFVGKTPEVIELGECALMVSGSVSLEMLARDTPAVVMYHAGPLTYAIGRIVVTCKYMSLPNLIVDRPIFPEFLVVGNPQAKVRGIEQTLDRWLTDRRQIEAVRAELEHVRTKVLATGATGRAADAVLARLPQSTPPVRRAA